MNEIRRDPQGLWHVASGPQGVYIRATPAGQPFTVGITEARAIALAILEVTNHADRSR
jgi:hypothetical protein